jgi:hypothetical protein
MITHTCATKLNVDEASNLQKEKKDWLFLKDTKNVADN